MASSWERILFSSSPFPWTRQHQSTRTSVSFSSVPAGEQVAPVWLVVLASLCSPALPSLPAAPPEHNKAPSEQATKANSPDSAFKAVKCCLLFCLFHSYSRDLEINSGYPDRYECAQFNRGYHYEQF